MILGTLWLDFWVNEDTEVMLDVFDVYEWRRGNLIDVDLARITGM